MTRLVGLKTSTKLRRRTSMAFITAIQTPQVSPLLRGCSIHGTAGSNLRKEEGAERKDAESFGLGILRAQAGSARLLVSDSGSLPEL